MKLDRYMNAMSWGIAICLILACGCRKLEDHTLGRYKFPGGESVIVNMSFDNSDPDIAFGGDVSLHFDVCGDAFYVGLVRNNPMNFELDKISSKGGNHVCFYSTSMKENPILFVVEPSRSGYIVSRPLKPQERINDQWDKKIVEKIRALEQGVRGHSDLRLGE